MHVTSSAPARSAEWLSAAESIKQLKARYFRTLDTKDWTGFRAVFADDARIGPIESGLPSSMPPAADTRPPDQFVQQVQARLAEVTSVHHGHMPEIELVSESEARGVWAMEDLLVFPAGAELAQLRGYGHYHETYVRGADGWKIRTMRLSRLRVDLT